MAERQFGPYRLIRQIAVGGMAEIHLAKTSGIAGFEKYVALKMIHPNFAEDDQFIQMLVDEAKIAVQLTHGNIAQTFDLGRVGETYYITMEYVDGADLYKMLRRASEQDIEMPLDVCAFIGKEITSALDHAHRKRDHNGKPLGIVHRDVSPQNVLISYSGEIKLVDFGIAKATMKARQTAVGVIKGKYYYMSPEQAWGDPIDYRSDIFSAGIVLYEMITGQMLYLEEDLHKLLDMARKAEIASPTKLRKGVPPQLERIVMHALSKVPGERYQSAGDFATDLERFLHTYSPVFTAGKVSSFIRKVLGDPIEIPIGTGAQEFPSIEMRDGAMSTMTIDDSELANSDDREQLRDENSVIFRVAELKPPKEDGKGGQAKKPAAAKAPVSGQPGPGMRAAPGPAIDAVRDRALKKTDPPPAMKPAMKVPSIAPVKPARAASPKPRQLHEETRQLVGVPPPASDEGSGLLSPSSGQRVAWDASETHPGDDDLDNIGERTIVNAPMGGGFMMDVAGDEGVDATLVGPPPSDPDTDQHTTGDTSPHEDPDDEEGPTLSRDAANVPARPSLSKGRSAQPPPALAAKIHAPAVSEIRKPRASRRTPPGGVNVLQQIVSSQPNEPMPTARPQAKSPPPIPQPQPPPIPQPQPPQFPTGTPGGQPAMMGYGTDASGLPLGLPTPVAGIPAQHTPGVPAHLQPYVQAQGVPPGYSYPYQYPSQPMAPGAVYPMQGQPMPPTLTGQMRLFEVDELPSQYRLGETRRRWFTYIIAGIIAISTAAIATFLIIRMTRETPTPETGSITVESVPPGADVYYDGYRLAGQTPMTIDLVPLNTRHTIKIVRAKHKPSNQTVDVPKTGGDINVRVTLDVITGKLVINTRPGNAEIRVDGRNVGRTPKTITDVDMSSAKELELRLKDYQPYVTKLTWPDDGIIKIDVPLVK